MCSSQPDGQQPSAADRCSVAAADGADLYVIKVEYAKEDFVLSECTFGRKTQQDPYTSDVLHSTGTVSERRQKCYDKRTEKS